MVALADTYTDFYVSPSPWLIVFSLLVVVVVAAGVVTALKGRWGWLIAGLLLGGLPWLIGLWLSPRPGSAWARRRGHAA